MQHHSLGLTRRGEAYAARHSRPRITRRRLEASIADLMRIRDDAEAAAIELIADLDVRDGDPDFEDDGSAEPELGATEDHRQQFSWRRPPLGNDGEPDMGVLENHPSGDPFGGNGSQVNWALQSRRGSRSDDDREEEHDDREPDVDEEPSLGSLGGVNQEKWASGQRTGEDLEESEGDAEPSLGWPEGRPYADAADRDFEEDLTSTAAEEARGEYAAAGWCGNRSAEEAIP